MVWKKYCNILIGKFEWGDLTEYKCIAGWIILK
jgi:hypothetical protein